MTARRAAALLALAACISLAGAAQATPGTASRGGAADAPAAGGEALGAKLSSRLLAAARAAQAGRARQALRIAGPTHAVRAGRVRVQVLAAPGAADAAARAVARAGGRVELRYRRLVDALVPPAGLERLAAAPEVAHVSHVPLMESESIPGEGVAATGASGWHGAGITGAGVRIAIVDAGFRGLRERQAAGDLPANVTTVDLCGGGLDGAEASEHGSGVAEIVHEMAPAASLYLICVGSLTSLGVAKDYVKNRGIRIVNFSATYYGTSRGDGSGSPVTPNGIVADARAAGVLWVNSAGNGAQRHWAGAFNDVDGNGWHEFAPGDERNDFASTVDEDEEICVDLVWDAWPATAEDYDLHVFDTETGSAVAESTNRQSGAQEPEEFLCWTNESSVSRSLGIAVRRQSAVGSPPLDLHVTNVSPRLEHQTAAGSVRVPASSPAALAVGAVCWPASGFLAYSAQGPTIDGRVKPDIAAPAGVSGATYGATASCTSGDGFHGTSASAPHVAGAAALVRQRYPELGVGELQAFLEAHVVDLGEGGKDNLYGAGALALGAAPPGPIPPPPPPPPADLAAGLAPSSASARVGERYGFELSVRNAGPFAADDVTVTGSTSEGAPIDWTAASSCSVSATAFTCAAGALDPGATWTVSLAGTAVRAGSTTVSVAVATSSAETDATNNAASATVRVLEPVRCVVPRIVGKTLAAARGALVRGHCRVGRVTRVFSSVPKGRVVRQQPAAGTRRVRGAPVAVVLSRGRR